MNESICSAKQAARMPYKRFYKAGKASRYPCRATTSSAPAAEAEKNKNNAGGDGNRSIRKRFTLH
jgi:hypothetical protein